MCEPVSANLQRGEQNLILFSIILHSPSGVKYLTSFPLFIHSFTFFLPSFHPSIHPSFLPTARLKHSLSPSSWKRTFQQCVSAEFITPTGLREYECVTHRCGHAHTNTHSQQSEALNLQDLRNVFI